MRSFEGQKSPFKIEYRYRPQEYGDQLVYIGATQDITEWKVAEAALKANETELRKANSELREAYDHIAEAQRLSFTGSFTWDVSKNEIFWSEEHYRIYEFDPATPVTLERIASTVHPADIQPFAAEVAFHALGRRGEPEDNRRGRRDDQPPARGHFRKALEPPVFGVHRTCRTHGSCRDCGVEFCRRITGQASNSLTTRPATSVRRKSRPWNR